MSARPPRRPIRRLAPETVERIAAGEVVERPASVVKELMENAIDAGATSITVRLGGGGLDRIEVADDGTGIPPPELELAVERHATSKLPPEGPIERIDSLGFRGEALAAIATVARLRILSRAAGHEVGEGLSVVGGTVAGRFAAPRSPGTTVEVEELFFNTPARRKFLKGPAAEQIEVARTVERSYLARPELSFRLEAEGRELAVYPGTSRLWEAAGHVFGEEFSRQAFELRGEVPGGRVVGILGRPPLSSPSSLALFLAVNGRPVVSRTVHQAVRAAFAVELPRGRFPVGAIHLEIDPEALDVNVHPTKREIRLAREREVAESLRVRVREALISVPSAPGAPPGAPGPAAVPPRGSRASAPPRRPVPMPAAAGIQQRLGSPPEALRGTGGGPGVRPRPALLGCLQALYWVAESPEGLVLFDQHAASERLLYETLRADGTLARQALVDPVVIPLSGSRKAALSAHAADVARAGFDVEPFGPGNYRVRSVPTYRGRRARVEALEELLDELAEGGRTTVPNGLRERRAATLACHAAIRAGDPVSAEEFARVLDGLAALPEKPSTCPHGRPIALEIPRGRLDRWFLRSGP